MPKPSYQAADETNDNKASTDDDNLLCRCDCPALRIAWIDHERQERQEWQERQERQGREEGQERESQQGRHIRRT